MGAGAASRRKRRTRSLFGSSRRAIRTALIGKYLNRYGQESTFGSLLSWAGSYLNISFTGPNIGNPEDWVPPGWDLWYAFTSSRARYYDYAINENELIKTFGSSPGDYSTDVLKARAVRFIQEQKGAADPFFMLVATAVGSNGTPLISHSSSPPPEPRSTSKISRSLYIVCQLDGSGGSGRMTAGIWLLSGASSPMTNFITGTL